MRFISLWFNTAFSTKYGSIFITTCWMGSTTRCILLRNPGPLRRELPPLHLPPETVTEQSAKEEEWRFQVLARCFLSDRLNDRLHSSVLLSEEVPSVQMPLPLFSSSSSLIWASPCVGVRLLPGGTYCSLHPLPRAHTTVPSVGFVCVTLLQYTVGYTSVRKSKSKFHSFVHDQHVYTHS